MTLAGIDDGDMPCRALEMASTGYTLTPSWVISIERHWMVELYETENCTGDPVLLQFEADTIIEDLSMIEWGWRI